MCVHQVRCYFASEDVQEGITTFFGLLGKGGATTTLLPSMLFSRSDFSIYAELPLASKSVEKKHMSWPLGCVCAFSKREEAAFLRFLPLSGWKGRRGAFGVTEGISPRNLSITQTRVSAAPHLGRHFLREFLLDDTPFPIGFHDYCHEGGSKLRQNVVRRRLFQVCSLWWSWLEWRKTKFCIICQCSRSNLSLGVIFICGR